MHQTAAFVGLQRLIQLPYFCDAPLPAEVMPLARAMGCESANDFRALFPGSPAPRVLREVADALFFAPDFPLADLRPREVCARGDMHYRVRTRLDLCIYRGRGGAAPADRAAPRGRGVAGGVRGHGRCADGRGWVAAARRGRDLPRAPRDAAGGGRAHGDMHSRILPCAYPNNDLRRWGTSTARCRHGCAWQ